MSLSLEYIINEPRHSDIRSTKRRPRDLVSLSTSILTQPQDVPIGTTIILFAQLFGGAIFASVATNIFNNHLITSLTKTFPGLDTQTIVNAGATNLKHVVPAEFLDQVLIVYNEAVVETFKLALILACFSLIGCALMQHTTVTAVKAADVNEVAEGN